MTILASHAYRRDSSQYMIYWADRVRRKDSIDTVWLVFRHWYMNAGGNGVSRACWQYNLTRFVDRMRANDGTAKNWNIELQNNGFTTREIELALQETHC